MNIDKFDINSIVLVKYLEKGLIEEKV